MKQLSGQDAAFLYLESSGAHLHVTALYVYEQAKPPHKPLRFEDITRLISSRLNTSPLFRQKLLRPPFDLDYPYWVDDPEFDSSRHLLRYPGPAPRNRRQLFDAVAALHAAPLDLNRPPWEMQVLEKLNRLDGLPASCFAIIARYHHAAIDGASGTQLVDRLHDSAPTAGHDAPDLAPVAGREPGALELLARAAINNVGIPFKLASAVASALPGIARSLVQPASPDAAKPDGVPTTRFNGPVSAERVFHATKVGLDEINRVRKMVPGATVNDVVLTICGGALRLWLEAVDELPEQSLVAMVPVNVRTADEVSRGGNQLSTLFLPIYTDQPDPLERLRAIHAATLQAKSASVAIKPRQVTDITNSIPALPLAVTARLVTSLGLGHRLLRLCNCTITNVPGPRHPLYLGPARLVFSTGSAPILDGMGLIITAFSYEGEVTFSITSCPEMLPDPEFLAQCTLQAFDLLRQATGAG